MTAIKKYMKGFGKTVLLLGGLLVAGSCFADELPVPANNQALSSTAPNISMDKLLKMAKAGDVDAMLGLGVIYYKGMGVIQNNVEAIRWFRQAADFRSADAMYNLGIIYLQRGSTPQSDREAVDWFHKAADLGNADAMSNLGLMYEEGRGVAQSYSEAVSWYRKAIELGNAYGMLNLANMYGRTCKIIVPADTAVAPLKKEAFF